MILFWSIETSRRDLCAYVVSDTERYAPGASEAQVRLICTVPVFQRLYTGKAALRLSHPTLPD